MMCNTHLLGKSRGWIPPEKMVGKNNGKDGGQYAFFR